MVSCRLNQNFQLEFIKWIFPIFRRPQIREGIVESFFYLKKKAETKLSINEGPIWA
jgi:hypothetical protein